ncbi:response regulator transcription factor [Chloroflexota bacterium]
MENNIRILLVDDHQVVREGLRHMLGREEELEVVGEAADAKLALTQVELLSPDVILMDIKMPGTDGIELTRQITETQSSCKVIMLTLYDEYLTQAIEAGAGGYLLKETKCMELVQAIKRVHLGEVVISESITTRPHIQYEGRAGVDTEVHPLQDDNDSDTLLEEVELVIHPPVDAGQLIRFIDRVEEAFQSHTLQMVGSWKGGTAVTIPLTKPTPITNILEILGAMYELEATGQKPLTSKGDSRLLNKVAAIPRQTTRPSKAIFVTLKNN